MFVLQESVEAKYSASREFGKWVLPEPVWKTVPYFYSSIVSAFDGR